MPKLFKALMPMIITCIVAGSVLAILAPLGTNQLTTLPRFSFWIGLCVVGGLGANAANFIDKTFRWNLKPWQITIGQSFTASITVAGAIVILTNIISGSTNWQQGLMVLFYVWVISATISGVGLLLSNSKQKDDNIDTRPTLYERMPAHLRSAEIYALAAEDHYVRIITARGDELVLMRLSDAIKETAPLNGLSPHRSWWVAEAGVEKIKKSEIILCSGQIVPISRTGMKQVRASGWK